MKKTALATALFCAVTGLGHAQTLIYPQHFDLRDVKLLDGEFRNAMEINDHVLLEYDVDRMMAPFYEQAGLDLPGGCKHFDNWIDLRGHVGGHYLTAIAQGYAASTNPETKAKMKTMLLRLMNDVKTIQAANDNRSDDGEDNIMAGYLGGVPTSLKMSLDYYSGKDVSRNYWVPWYNIHKIYAGVRDIYLYCHDDEDKEVAQAALDARAAFIKICDWGVKITSNLTPETWEAMLGTEYGGMNEMYADAYALTKNSTDAAERAKAQEYLKVAHLFSQKWLIDGMVAKNNTLLDGKHANTQIPKVIGFERVRQVMQDDSSAPTYKNITYTKERYGDATDFFWQDVVQSRNIALGGNSVNEHFQSAANCNRYIESDQGPESCNTYNLMKLTEMLFSDTHDALYSDYYEQALFNHIRSTQHPEHGGYVYFTSARPQHYRVYSAVNEAMWCCVGTGLENHEKYGHFIYTHSGDNLFVNLFISSELNWKEKGITITQQTNFPYEQGTKLSVKGGSCTLQLRHPGWCKNFAVKKNGVAVDVSNSKPQSYMALAVNDGDVVEVSTPMELAYAECPHYKEYVAFTYGPVLLGAKMDGSDIKSYVADDSRWGHIAGRSKNLTSAPIIEGDDRSKLASIFKLTDAKTLTFEFDANQSEFKMYNAPAGMKLIPFSNIHDSRYMMYWWVPTREEFADERKKREEEEAKKQLLEAATLTGIRTGEMQPDRDYNLQFGDSEIEKGIFQEEAYVHINSGWFSYTMVNNRKTKNIQLMVRYWGNESGNRTFDIYIDNKLLVKGENNNNRWNKKEFVDVLYDIPASMLKGKKEIEVKFVAHPGNYAGGVFHLWLLENYKPYGTK